MDKRELKQMKLFAAQIRLETVKCIGARGFGHIGGSLSIVDALAALYGGVMSIDPARPDWAGRDKLVMSKGHAGPALYATLALKGYFPMDWLKTLNQPGTKLPSHCDKKLTPGVDMTTGSLGQGVSTAIGLAIAQQLDGNGARTFLVTGDGELDEGQAWEGALFAPQRKLANLTWLVDYNKKQLDARTEEVIDQRDIAAKAHVFGWNALNINGNDMEAVCGALEVAKEEKTKPTCIVLNTIKGAGVPVIEQTELNHSMNIEGDLLKECVAHCEAALAAIGKEAA